VLKVKDGEESSTRMKNLMKKFPASLRLARATTFLPSVARSDGLQLGDGMAVLQPWAHTPTTASTASGLVTGANINRHALETALAMAV